MVGEPREKLAGVCELILDEGIRCCQSNQFLVGVSFRTFDGKLIDFVLSWKFEIFDVDVLSVVGAVVPKEVELSRFASDSL